MAFIYITDTSSKKDLEKACTDKLNAELKPFKKEWKVLGFFRGETKNEPHKTRWEGVVGVK